MKTKFLKFKPAVKLRAFCKDVPDSPKGCATPCLPSSGGGICSNSTPLTNLEVGARGWGGLKRLTEGFGLRIIDLDEMPGLWELAFADFGDILAEGGDALFLEPLVFGEKVPIGFRMAGKALVVFAEEIVGKEKLGIATRA